MSILRMSITRKRLPHCRLSPRNLLRKRNQQQPNRKWKKLPNLSISLDENGKPRLTWDEVEGAAEYQIYYATAKNGKYKKLDTVTDLTFTYEAARKGKTCCFKVRAVDQNGTTGDFSSIKSIKSK